MENIDLITEICASCWFVYILYGLHCLSTVIWNSPKLTALYPLTHPPLFSFYLRSCHNQLRNHHNQERYPLLWHPSATLKTSSVCALSVHPASRNNISFGFTARRHLISSSACRYSFMSVWRCQRQTEWPRLALLRKYGPVLKKCGLTNHEKVGLKTSVSKTCSVSVVRTNVGILGTYRKLPF